MDEDLGRYSSAAGWEPRDPQKKLRERLLREFESKPRPGQSMLAVRPASHWITRPSVKLPRAELYGQIWREGDVCVMFGPKGVGKSLFVTQLAEDIATGARSLTTLPEPGAIATSLLRSVPKTKNPLPKVLLIDLEHTTDQFTERFTFPSPVPGKLPCRTRFHFQRASVCEFDEIPKCFKGRIHDFLVHSIGQAIAESGAQVVIIDSITYMFRGRTAPGSMANAIKSLKLYAHSHNVSILATAQTPTKRPTAAPAAYAANPLARYARELQLAALADSAFILAPSTYGPEYRYIKLLATRNQIPAKIAPTSSEVLTYQLSLNSSFDIRNSSFTYLGPSAEQDHLRDYAAEAVEAERLHQRELRHLRKRSSKDILVDAVIDGSYARYLKGD